MAAPDRRSPIVVTHESGLAFAAQVRGHRVLTDQSERAGGADCAPSPTELISVALGSCIALYVHQFCEARGLPHEGMRVEVMPLHATSPNRIAQLEVTLRLPQELPSHAMEMLERVVRSCPVHNTLAHGASVSVTIAPPVQEHATAS
jgi:uncharacterized OsmC-like protein